MNKFGTISAKNKKLRKKVIAYREKEIENMLYLDSNVKMINLGAGTCHYANYFSDKVSVVVALDSSKKILQFANDLVKVVITDITERLPIDNASYDCLLLNYVINQLPLEKHANVIKEIHRVLKPGGCFIVQNFEKRSSSAKLLHIFKFVIFRKRMNYVHFNDLLEQLKTDFEIKKIKHFGDTFIVKSEKI